MQIESYNSHRATSASARMQRIGGVLLPDFNNNLTKRKPLMSDEEFKEAIINQAKKDYAEGKQNSQAAQQLKRAYISVVSPDRKKIITQGLKQLEQIIKDPLKRHVDLLQLLAFGTVNYKKETGEITFAEFKDSNGEMVASYHKGNWKFFATDAEAERGREIANIYTDAWSTEYKKGKVQQKNF